MRPKAESIQSEIISVMPCNAAIETVELCSRKSSVHPYSRQCGRTENSSRDQMRVKLVLRKQIDRIQIEY